MDIRTEERWAGREFRSVIELVPCMLLVLNQGDYITMVDLLSESTNDFGTYSDDLRDAMRAYEKEYIRRVLLASDGNKEEAARRLGIDPSTLYRKMAKLGFDREDTAGDSLP